MIESPSTNYVPLNEIKASREGDRVTEGIWIDQVPCIEYRSDWSLHSNVLPVIDIVGAV